MTHTDPIKALVELGPELQKRYDSRTVMNPTGSILLTYEETPIIIAAIEALKPPASPATPERILELEDKLERLGASLQLISCNGHLSGSYLADIARIALKSKEPSP